MFDPTDFQNYLNKMRLWKENDPPLPEATITLGTVALLGGEEDALLIERLDEIYPLNKSSRDRKPKFNVAALEKGFLLALLYIEANEDIRNFLEELSEVPSFKTFEAIISQGLSYLLQKGDEETWEKVCLGWHNTQLTRLKQPLQSAVRLKIKSLISNFPECSDTAPSELERFAAWTVRRSFQSPWRLLEAAVDAYQEALGDLLYQGQILKTQKLITTFQSLEDGGIFLIGLGKLGEKLANSWPVDPLLTFSVQQLQDLTPDLVKEFTMAMERKSSDKSLITSAPEVALDPNRLLKILENDYLKLNPKSSLPQNPAELGRTIALHWSHSPLFLSRLQRLSEFKEKIPEFWQGFEQGFSEHLGVLLHNRIGLDEAHQVVQLRQDLKSFIPTDKIIEEHLQNLAQSSPFQTQWYTSILEAALTEKPTDDKFLEICKKLLPQVVSNLAQTQKNTAEEENSYQDQLNDINVLVELADRIYSTYSWSGTFRRSTPNSPPRSPMLTAPSA